MLASEVHKDIYTCDSVTTVFPYTFKILDESHIKVIKYTIADGTISILTLNVDYTVSDVGVDAGGNITLLIAAPSSDYKLIFLRDIPLKQEADYVEHDDFPAESHEAALDKLTMMMQRIKEIVDRAIVANESYTAGFRLPLPEAGKAIGWNATADGLENITV